MINKVTGSVLLVLATAGFAMAAVNVGVDVNTPNVRVQAGTTQPPPRVAVVERERVLVKEKVVVEGKKDHGKHKGHYKKHKKHDR
jgi:hypothetical protein